MTQIKICGIKRIEDTVYINDSMPEYAGFVFWDKSSRNVSFELAKELRNAIDKRIKTVGVFVDMDIDSICYLVKEKIISVVQLHGNETDDIIERLRCELPEGTTILKAFEVKDESDVKRANDSKADMVLIDSGKGSGSTFDWDLLKSINRDYFLAGGLSSENVAGAIKALHPFAVDVSSKVETDGFKDVQKIKAFCNAVRNAEKSEM